MTVSTAGPYRPDIDGLRAIAVMAVIFFHARVPGFDGGYVGVDVFFVLSGYLITAQLLRAAGTPIRSMLAQFYFRRARRILPALSVVLAAALAAAAILLLPYDLERLGRAATLSVVFAGNIAAWTSDAYFVARPSHQPLLHLWTIGIEEQFYLLFPLSLWLAMRYFRTDRIGLLVGACALVSFVICVWAADAHPLANFYLAPSRAWELLLGAMLAIRPPRPVRAPLARELLAAGAASTILLAILLYDGEMKYPYFSTLAPCVATVVLIASGLGNPALTNRVLALRPLVFIGLISYSLYLWHVPVQTLFEYYTIRELTTAQTVGWLCVTFVLAVASWAFIEKPVRERRLLHANRRFTVCMVVVAVGLAAVGLLYWRSAGLPQRIPESLHAMTDGRDRFHADISRCMTITPSQIASGELCHYGSGESSARRLIVWGDSHALALLPAFESLAIAHGASLYFAGVIACQPLIGVASRHQREGTGRRCDEYNAAMFRAIERLDPAIVVMASYWTNPDVDLVPTGAAFTGNEELLAAGLRGTLDRRQMQGRVTCLVLDVPRLNYSVPNAYGRAVLRGMDTDFLAMDRVEALQQLAPAEDVLKRMQAQGVLLADPKELLCPLDVCRFDAPTGELLYGDDNHLSVHGAHFVAPALEPCFQ
jgi:peptidoglycan/LPS O-acetylase OafA/YrhL